MSNIFTTIRPLYLVSKIFGFFPMSFEGPPEKGNFVVMWRDLITPFLNGLLAILLVASVHLYPLDSKLFTPLMTSITHFIGIFGTILNFTQLVFQTSKHRSIAKFIMDLNSFDKKVGSDIGWNVVLKILLF